MLQYRCDDQGGPQPPKPWKEGDKEKADKAADQEKKEDQESEEKPKH